MIALITFSQVYGSSGINLYLELDFRAPSIFPPSYSGKIRYCSNSKSVGYSFQRETRWSSTGFQQTPSFLWRVYNEFRWCGLGHARASDQELLSLMLGIWALDHIPSKALPKRPLVISDQNITPEFPLYNAFPGRRKPGPTQYFSPTHGPWHLTCIVQQHRLVKQAIRQLTRILTAYEIIFISEISVWCPNWQRIDIGFLVVVLTLNKLRRIFALTDGFFL